MVSQSFITRVYAGGGGRKPSMVVSDFAHSTGTIIFGSAEFLIPSKKQCLR